MRDARVATTRGVLRGSESGGILSFKGIPFAAPPVGARRWGAPEPPDRWTGERDATQFGPSAWQASLGSMGELIGIAAGPMSEDCLYLNVWTPACDDRRRPVMVWIHGGGNLVGSGSQPRIHGDRLARAGDVVVVTLNYRLGALGFLHCPELGASGNEALLDQVAALRWVRQEIGAFGGDPGNVTVFGQSAGAFDIAELMAMPAAAGCFDAAIPMSGSISQHVSREDAAALADRFLAHFGGAAKLRETPADAVLAFQQEVAPASRLGRFGPVRDGAVIREDAAGPIARGDHTRGIPLLIGHTLDEWGLWTGMDDAMAALDDAGLARLAARLFGPRSAEAIALYRDARTKRGQSTRCEALWTAMMTDARFRMPAILTAELHSRHTPDTWMYRFDYASPAVEGNLGACHSLDVPFVWGTFGSEGMARFCGTGPEVEALSARIMRSYLAFARHHDPASDALPEWPRYDVGRRATLRFGLECSVAEAPMDEERAFWASLPRSSAGA